MYKVFNLKRPIKILFVVYILFLVYVLFLKTDYRLKIPFEFLSKEHFDYCLNLKPFSTVRRYTRAFLNHNVTLGVFLENIVGNFILFVPLSFFVVYKIDKISVWKYTLILLIMIILIEFLQFYYMIGVADIDDIILNLIGGILSMTFLRIIKK